MGVEGVVRSNRGDPGQVNMRTYTATRSNGYLPVNDCEWPNFNRGIQLGARADDGRGMDHVPPMRGEA